MRLSLLFLLFLLFSCNKSLEDLRRESDSLTKEMTKDLQRIHTKEDLIKFLPTLRKYYLSYAKLIEKTEKLCKNSEEIGVEQQYPLQSSYYLYKELIRVSEIKGAKEILQKAQKDAIRRLEQNNLY